MTGPPADDPPPPAGWLAGAVVLGLFATLAFSVRSVLGPFILYALFLYVVWPWIGRPVVSRLAVGATALVLLWLVHATGLLLAPFILALILAYVLDPIVDRLQVWMPRPAAIGLLALPLVGVLALLVFVVIPAVASQLSELIAAVPAYVNVLERWAASLRAWVISLEIQGLDEQTLPGLGDVDAQALARYLQRRRAELASSAGQAVLGIGRGIGAVLAVLGYLVLLPILTYYLLRDWDRIREILIGLVPETQRDGVRRFADEYDDLLGRYLRGQLLLALVVGLLVGIGFRVVGFPYALLLGLLAGVLNIVPYLGLVASITVALVIALFSGTVLASLAKVGVVFGVEQVIENILGPKIVGESVGLNPAWIILALALFSFFFGFVGLLLAVPAAVLAKLALGAAVARYRESEWFARDGFGR